MDSTLTIPVVSGLVVGFNHAKENFDIAKRGALYLLARLSTGSRQSIARRPNQSHLMEIQGYALDGNISPQLMGFSCFQIARIAVKVLSPALKSMTKISPLNVCHLFRPIRKDRVGKNTEGQYDTLRSSRLTPLLRIWIFLM